MTERRWFVIAVLVMSLSLLVLPVAMALTLGSTVFTPPSGNWMSGPIAGALKPVMAVLCAPWYVGLFVLVVASMAELAIDRWGVEKVGVDEATQYDQDRNPVS